MSMSKWFQEKWINRVKQFGWKASFSQAIRALLRTVWQVSRDIVFAIPEQQQNQQLQHSDIKIMTEEMVETAAKRGELTKQQRKLLLQFLNENCRGFMAFVENSLAGYGFVQTAGIYHFGHNGRFQIPPNMMVFKNLLVFTKYRGGSIGKKINQARRDAIPKNCVPLGFIIFENRYALRNWKMFGAEEMLIVIRTTLFKKWTVQRIKVLKDCNIAHRIIEGL